VAAGGGQFCLYAGTYYLRVEHVSGGNARVDFVAFDLPDSPVDGTSWGSIKALYR
jgi:hypothetical protein